MLDFRFNSVALFPRLFPWVDLAGEVLLGDHGEAYQWDDLERRAYLALAMKRLRALSARFMAGARGGGFSSNSAKRC